MRTALGGFRATLAVKPSQRTAVTAISLPRRACRKRRPVGEIAAWLGSQDPAGVVNRSTARTARLRPRAERVPPLVLAVAARRATAPPNCWSSSVRPRLVSLSRTVTARAPRRGALARPRATTCPPASSAALQAAMLPDVTRQRTRLPLRPNTETRDTPILSVTGAGAAGDAASGAAGGVAGRAATRIATVAGADRSPPSSACR